MKNIKRFIFPLSLVLLLAACSRNSGANSSKKEESKSSENPSSVVSSSSEAPSSSDVVSSDTSESQPASESSIPEVSDFTLIDPTDTSMLSENCKAYIDAMREQEEEYADESEDKDFKYKYFHFDGNDFVSVENFLDEGEVEGQNKTVSGKIPDRSDKNMGVNLKFESDLDLEASEYKVLVSLDEDDFSDAKEFAVEQDGEDFVANANNLFVNTEYFWKVVTEDDESPVSSFATGDYPRWISARPLYNVRDNGGYMTYSGKRVKQGLVFRGGEITSTTVSGHYNTIAESSKEVFRNEMKIGFELDLRGTSDIYDNYKACAFAEDGDIDYEMHAIKSYEETFTKTRSEVAAIFHILANADEKPVYYHCFGGADRTGTLGFLLNGLLGVSYTDLVIDFELTSYSSINNEHIRNHMNGHQHQYDRWPALINQIKTDTTGGYEWDDDALLMENIENFLVQACSVDQDDIDAIKDIMLED